MAYYKDIVGAPGQKIVVQAQAVEWNAALTALSDPAGGNFISVVGGHLHHAAAITTNFTIAAKKVLPANSMGRNGTAKVDIVIDNWSGSTATYSLMFGGQTIWQGSSVSGTLVVTVTIENMNSSQSQRANRVSAGDFLTTSVNTEADVNVELFIAKTAAADQVVVRRLSLHVQKNNVLMEEAFYVSTTGQKTVVEADLLQYPLSSAAANDPRFTVRNLAPTAYTFPSTFFNLCVITWPITTTTPLPVGTKGIRSGDYGDISWGMQTAQATVAYSPTTGAAPAGIAAVGLAKLDILFATANTNGLDLIVLLHGGPRTPLAWLTALGGNTAPLSIPVAGVNRDAILASLGFFVRYLCERYTTMYPSLTWYIEPVNEPNGPGEWSGTAADFVAWVSPVRTNVTNFGGTKVKLLCSSFNAIIGIDGANPGASIFTLSAYLGAGGWSQFDIATYHLYGGMTFTRNLDPTDAYAAQGLFWHTLGLVDPLNSAATQGNYIGIPAIFQAWGLGATITPGVSTKGGKALWITECGEAYAVTRDRNFYIRLALICSALGVTKYFFYYWGGITSGALPEMDIAQNPAEFQAAQDFLYGKTINWVNATRDLAKVGASINGVVYQF